MSRLPLRVRLTLVFAGVTSVVLVAVGVFAYLDVKQGLDASLDQGLRARADELTALAARPARLRVVVAAAPDAEQVLAADGSVLLASPGAGAGPLLSPAQARSARRASLSFEEDERVRILARPLASGRIVVVTASMAQREHALEVLAGVLIGGGILILLASSAAGYAVATGALRPVERMRRRAESIPTATSDARLPLPEARDEIRRLGETLNDMLGRLEDASSRERAFLAAASHELRTPLAILRAEVELALRHDEAEDDRTETLRSIGEEVERLIRLAEDLLVVTRWDGTDLPVSPVPTALDPLLERLALRLRPLAEVRVDGAGLWIRADGARVEQALAGLVDNAVRHAGGPVTISARRAGTAVEVTVADTGAGFPPGIAGTVLEPVPRMDVAGGGFGLGLAMVAAIARAHGGEARASNADGGGRVTITLPAVTAPAALPAAP